MRLSKIEIKNYRCLTDVEIPVEDYTAFIGPNGTGKSSVLYALDWFFGGRPATSDDISWECSDTFFEVAVTFSNLSDTVKKLLGQFGRDGTARFTRRYDSLSSSATYWGRALSGPGFQEVLATNGIANVRAAYSALQNQLPDLKVLSGAFSTGAIEASFEDWESRPENHHRLVTIDELDAKHLFVANGPISQIVQYILIKGSTDLATQLDASGRASTLNMLTEKLVTPAKKEALETWKEEHREDLRKLEQMTAKCVEAATRSHQEQVNVALKQYLPHAEVLLRTSDIRVGITNDAPITSKIRMFKGEEKDVTSEGHGNQRAVMMAMVQSLAEINAPDNDDVLLIIAAEEPEIYQHPIRVRYFARALSGFAKHAGSQVLVATHSAYFVRPEHIQSLRKMHLERGVSSVAMTSAAEIASKLDRTEHEISRRTEKEIPGIFSECLFAHSVVLVEGDTDRVILNEIADQIGQPFDAAGITLFSVGSKTDFKLYYTILTDLRIPTFVVFDGDFLAADQKYPDDLNGREKAHESNRGQTIDCLSLLDLLDEHGNPTGFAFGSPSWIGATAVAFHDCIEAELSSWASFHRELRNLRAKPDGKNAFAYRLAAQRALKDEIPTFLIDVVDAIHQHASGTR